MRYLSNWQGRDEFILLWGRENVRTITNAANEVVEWMVAHGIWRPGRRLLYLDSAGIWDELVVDANGMFQDFRSVGGTSVEDAIHKARGLPSHDGLAADQPLAFRVWPLEPK